MSPGKDLGGLRGVLSTFGEVISSTWEAWISFPLQMRKLTFGEVKSFAQRDRKRLKHWTAGHRAGVTVQGAGQSGACKT